MQTKSNYYLPIKPIFPRRFFVTVGACMALAFAVQPGVTRIFALGAQLYEESSLVQRVHAVVSLIVTSAILGFLAGYAGYHVADLLRWKLLRRLLTYQAWINEPNSLKIKLTPVTVGACMALAFAVQPGVTRIFALGAQLYEESSLVQRVRPVVSLIVTSAILGILAGYAGCHVADLLRWKLLRRLLTYQGWINEPNSLKIKMWGILVKLLVGPGPFSSCHLQSVIFRQPVPDFQATLDRWLMVTNQWPTAEEYAPPKEAAFQFQTNEGPKLQQYLKEQAEKSDAWLSDYWVNIVYLSSSPSPAVDLTIKDKEKGAEVVDAVVGRIRQSCLFSDDRLFLRRLAKAESDDGLAEHTFKRGGIAYYGGIWQITESDFLATQISAYELKISDNFGVEWSKVAYKELWKPLYSGLAASIKLEEKLKTNPLKGDCTFQEVNWQTIYLPGRETPATADFNGAWNTQQGFSVPKADIVFVMDGSGSIGAADFVKSKEFVVDVVKGFDIGADKVQISVIQYSSDGVLEIDLGALDNKAALEAAILAINYQSGGSNSAAGLEKMGNVFDYKGRSDDGVPAICIFITDGRSNDATSTEKAAAKAHAKGITVFAIGVGSNLNVPELYTIGSTPNSLHVYTLANFVEVSSCVSQIKGLSCQASAEIPDGKFVKGDLQSGQAMYFKTKVQKSKGGATIKVKMDSGSTKLYVAWSTRNPGYAIYDKMKTFTSVAEDNLFIPAPGSVGSTDESELYAALVGDGAGAPSTYQLMKEDGDTGNEAR